MGIGEFDLLLSRRAQDTEEGEVQQKGKSWILSIGTKESEGKSKLNLRAVNRMEKFQAACIKRDASGGLP